ncbi:MAG: hypothetical protein ACR65W_16290 [Methylocystis sp.]|uniref:hypothetical protein n=1 Tax=Methylocystis sp. TaxID=1911079 RepID=UPI003DA4C6CF
MLSTSPPGSKHASIDLKVIMLMTSVLPSISMAIEDKEVMACAAISNDVSRLECFDSISARHNLAPHTQLGPISGVGKWYVSSKVNPLDDQSIHYAILDATDAKNRWGKPVSLTVRCESNRTEMYINWNDFLGSDAYTTFRVDKDAAKKSNWQLSTDKTAAFHPGSPVGLLKRIAKSNSFIASITPYNESPVTAVFETSSAAGAFAEIRKSCNW